MFVCEMGGEGSGTVRLLYLRVARHGSRGLICEMVEYCELQTSVPMNEMKCI